MYKTIRCRPDTPIAEVTLNRPDIRNAFNEVMISELTGAFRRLKQVGGVRAVILTGEGKAFCAGADINWMKKMKDYSREENLKDAMALADLMEEIFDSPFVVLGAVNGAAIGGGTGLVAVCDIAVTTPEARFSFSEVRIGLVPACISPYVVNRVGFSTANRLFITGERFDGEKAMQIGLVDEVVPAERLPGRVNELAESILSNGPSAVARAKRLLRDGRYLAGDEMKRYNAEMIADLRTSEEGQEGLAAFLEKRKPKWAPGGG